MTPVGEGVPLTVVQGTARRPPQNRHTEIAFTETGSLADRANSYSLEQLIVIPSSR